MVLPAKGKSFDPTKIPRAVQDAGFTPGEVIVTGAGTLTRADGLLRLNMAGRVPQFVLGGGAKAGELNGRTDLQGKRIRVTGKLHASHGGKPPAITVDAFTVVSD